MGWKLKFKGRALVLAAASVLLVAALKVPLPWVLLALLPISIAAEVLMLRKARP
jgi:flagellar biosynthesis component FlhA